MSHSVTLASPFSEIYKFLELQRLLVLDLPGQENLILEHFYENDLQVKSAEDIDEFLILLKSYAPQLIILSVEMFQRYRGPIQNQKLELPLLLLGRSLNDMEAPNLTGIEVVPYTLFTGNKIPFFIQKTLILKNVSAKTQQHIEPQNIQNQDSSVPSKSQFIKRLSSNLEKPLEQLVQFSHIGLQRVQRKKWTQVGHYLAEIKMISEEMMSYIHDLKEIALLKSREELFEIEEIDVLELLRSVKRQFQPIADSRDITLNIRNQINHPLVKADYNKLVKVLNIIIKTLIKSMPENTVLKIRTSHDASFFKIYVVDAGWFFQSKPSKHYFDIFDLQDFGNSSQAVGFSLSVCKELMLAQGGDIVVESVDSSQDYCFALSLPLVSDFLDELTS
ncbi:MAG: Adaptive-response sensory-kinase SasA [Chlamydiae bacterium]|nr:Adaptive-response sensory-kinase SasA [Chlamydiota bacterium]